MQCPLYFFGVVETGGFSVSAGSFRDDEMNEMNALVESNAMILVNAYVFEYIFFIDKSV